MNYPLKLKLTGFVTAVALAGLPAVRVWATDKETQCEAAISLARLGLDALSVQLEPYRVGERQFDWSSASPQETERLRTAFHDNKEDVARCRTACANLPDRPGLPDRLARCNAFVVAGSGIPQDIPDGRTWGADSPCGPHPTAHNQTCWYEEVLEYNPTTGYEPRWVHRCDGVFVDAFNVMRLKCECNFLEGHDGKPKCEWKPRVSLITRSGIYDVTDQFNKGGNK